VQVDRYSQWNRERLLDPGTAALFGQPCHSFAPDPLVADGPVAFITKDGAVLLHYTACQSAT